MNKTEFFLNYGHLLVKVNSDDAQTGDFMLFFPEETNIAKKYLDNGYSVAYVFEVENNEDNVELDNDLGYSHHKIGLLVLQSEKQYYGTFK
jgi:hypothetical protein